MVTSHEAERVLSALVESHLRGPHFRKEAMLLLSSLEGYDWCGVYRLDGDALTLDEYVGAATDHVRIPVGVGVCGTAVAERANQVVKDVRQLANYLSCSVQTRSEIVVLIKGVDGDILGQIDIDGHEVDAFGLQDERFLESVAKEIAVRW